MSQLVIKSDLARISIVDKNETPMPLYFHDGHFYVMAVPGTQYQIFVQNNSEGRLNVAAFVDGSYTLENKVADLLTCDGLVIPEPPYIYKIHGFGTEVTQAFEFKANDYDTVAVRAGRGNARLGLIEIVIYAEYARPIREKYLFGNNLRGGSPESFGKGSRPGGAIGTGMGDEVKQHSIGTTHFRRAVGGPEIVTIYAKSENWLRANGVIGGQANDADHPSSFPKPMTGDYWNR